MKKMTLAVGKTTPEPKPQVRMWLEESGGHVRLFVHQSNGANLCLLHFSDEGKAERIGSCSSLGNLFKFDGCGRIVFEDETNA